ncbi:holocytochrome c synthase [Terramyces sp. JEL0728]|nr:holocytochrome c synthase [Terramyces sp. JEL0728]
MVEEKSKCPVDHSKLNPWNMMPTLSQEKTENQKTNLSTERILSGIPKSSQTGEKWEYPSPQQFYNALKRKNKEAPEENIDMMVDIHNFLNEGSWQEILNWEKKYHCECEDIGLLKFQGKPDQLSPKAWFFSAVYGTEKPFDRHDWTVDRCGKPVRYIIDYYGGVDGENAASFNVDVRPALDSPSAVFDRLKDGFGFFWDKAFK